MIKLKELIELQSMVYTETIKPKHKKRFTRPNPSDKKYGKKVAKALFNGLK